MQKTLLALGVSLLAATSGQAQPSSLARPITVTFVRPITFEQAISTLAQMSDITIEFDQTVSDEVRKAPIAETTITFRNATLQDSLSLVTSKRGLDYRVVDGKTVLIFKKV